MQAQILYNCTSGVEVAAEEGLLLGTDGGIRVLWDVVVQQSHVCGCQPVLLLLLRLLCVQVPQYLYVETAADSSPAQLSTTGWLKPLYRPSATAAQHSTSSVSEQHLQAAQLKQAPLVSA